MYMYPIYDVNFNVKSELKLLSICSTRNIVFRCRTIYIFVAILHQSIFYPYTEYTEISILNTNKNNSTLAQNIYSILIGYIKIYIVYWVHVHEYTTHS